MARPRREAAWPAPLGRWRHPCAREFSIPRPGSATPAPPPPSPGHRTLGLATGPGRRRPRVPSAQSIPLAPRHAPASPRWKRAPRIGGRLHDLERQGTPAGCRAVRRRPQDHAVAPGPRGRPRGSTAAGGPQDSRPKQPAIAGDRLDPERPGRAERPPRSTTRRLEPAPQSQVAPWAPGHHGRSVACHAPDAARRSPPSAATPVSRRPEHSVTLELAAYRGHEFPARCHRGDPREDVGSARGRGLRRRASATGGGAGKALTSARTRGPAARRVRQDSDEHREPRTRLSVHTGAYRTRGGQAETGLFRSERGERGGRRGGRWGVDATAGSRGASLEPHPTRARSIRRTDLPPQPRAASVERAESRRNPTPSTAPTPDAPGGASPTVLGVPPPHPYAFRRSYLRKRHPAQKPNK